MNNVAGAVGEDVVTLYTSNSGQSWKNGSMRDAETKDPLLDSVLRKRQGLVHDRGIAARRRGITVGKWGSMNRFAWALGGL